MTKLIGIHEAVEHNGGLVEACTMATSFDADIFHGGLPPHVVKFPPHCARDGVPTCPKCLALKG